MTLSPEALQLLAALAPVPPLAAATWWLLRHYFGGINKAIAQLVADVKELSGKVGLGSTDIALLRRDVDAQGKELERQRDATHDLRDFVSTKVGQVYVQLAQLGIEPRRRTTGEHEAAAEPTEKKAG